MLKQTWKRLSNWQKYCLIASIPTFLVAALVGFIPMYPYLAKLLELVLEGLGGAFFVIGFLGFLEIYGTAPPQDVAANSGTSPSANAAVAAPGSALPVAPTSVGIEPPASSDTGTIARGDPRPQEAPEPSAPKSDHNRVER